MFIRSSAVHFPPATPGPAWAQAWNALELGEWLRHLRRVKIALVRRNYSNVGGAELYVERLLGKLAAAGHELHIFSENWPKRDGFEVHTVETSSKRARRPIEFAERAQQQLSRHKFDCVFSLERTLRQDVYRAGDGVHRVWLQRRKQFSSWWKKPFIGRGAFHRAMCRLEQQTFDPANTGRIIVNSEMVKAEIIREFDFPETRIHLVRNGVDLCRFQRGNRGGTRARFGIRDHEFVLLFAGSGWERKGLRFVLEALKRFAPDELKLLVVGKGKQPVSAPRNAIFASSMPDIENAYAAADLFVFLPIYEPSANVCIEALAAGLPVITSAFNGAAELIAPSTGITIQDPSDIDCIVQAIRSWKDRWQRIQPPDPALLDIDRNVAETLEILELAGREKRA